MREEEGSSVKSRALEMLRRNLGPDVNAALNDERTIEVMLNPDGTLWHERLGEPMRLIGSMSPQRAKAVIETVAGYYGNTVTRTNPICEGELPIDGSRFAGQLPPIVENPTFAIRKKASAIFTVGQYVEDGMMTAEQAAAIRKAVAEHRNVLVIGGTSSGKTTLLNALIHEVSVVTPNERVAIIEDTGELQCSMKNKVPYHTSINVTMTMILKLILRMRPDRILVGEVRDGAALDLLDAWNTGHEGGFATIHANNPEAALIRLKSLVTRNPAAPKDIESLIGEAVHVIVHIAKTETGRRIQGILEIQGYKDGHYITRNL
ncbi:P-type conjugative transfer ATPase TrbB [Burkholderia cenocepacia]|uniref:P-type conjugative transfer ATPase TrbB n=1 Tax=Burkholderia cenocepacia TaxID=95486 RepID=UPI002ABE8D82|nr:P-type conjugative transfer ATPase TrbB [Burkholderia cenocepacia]